MHELGDEAIEPVAKNLGASGAPESATDGQLLALEGIGKSYSGVSVLKDVAFSVKRGETVVLVGENGAGKSTLKNILCGLTAPDVGTITFHGKSYSRFSTADATALGIAAIHQELSLFANLSVAENIWIDALPVRNGLVDTGALRSSSLRLLADLFGSGINPSEPVERLSLGERQLVEIAKAVRRASTLLILDEPTASLSIPERRRLFDVVARLKERGYGLIYITHFLEEVYELADRIVVLRDGTMVASGAPAAIGRRDLERLMVGRELADTDASLAAIHSDSVGLLASGEVVLRVQQLTDHTLLDGITFDLHAGEILGLAGLMGAGRTEVAHSVFGLRAADGTIEIAGRPFARRNPRAAKARGVALVSEDRRAVGCG